MRVVLLLVHALVETKSSNPGRDSGLLGKAKGVLHEDVAADGDVSFAEAGKASAAKAEHGDGSKPETWKTETTYPKVRPVDREDAVVRPAEKDRYMPVISMQVMPAPEPHKEKKKTLFGLETLHALFSPLNIPVVIRPQQPGVFGNTSLNSALHGVDAGTDPSLAGLYNGKSLHDARQAEMQRRRWLMSGVAQYLNLPKAVAERLTVQDVAVLVAVMAFYIATLSIALSLVYHTSVVRSGVKWFSEPEMLTCTGTTYSAFCSVFNRAPQTHVRIKSTRNGVTQMDVALDVTNFIETEDDWLPAPIGKRSEPLGGGSLSAEDIAKVEQFVQTDRRLATMVMTQSVAWDDFQQLQPLVKEKLKAMGCDDDVQVTFERARDPIIRRNTQLYHFMNNNITLILALMSIVGPLIFWPVAWWQRKTWYTTARFRIALRAEEYFPLVVDALPLAIEATQEALQAREQEQRAEAQRERERALRREEAREDIQSD